MADSLEKERFGRFVILDHLVDGGMAKICRAIFMADQVDKIVAIKMIQPQLHKEEAFKTMFMDEIKMTFGLIHPNIVQTYDYGVQKGQLYVAMEYCDGRNLKEYLDKLKEKKFVFPVEISTYIISQACQGLYYAHTYQDKLTGQSANIIHRDISPHNIMLTYDGSIKIIDFGIAKSQINSEETQAGTIKGKLSYLAPEYLAGLELDAKYDQFALGITLWEMLCSRKLFKENNDLAVIRKIQECVVPEPSSINPNVPKELDEIVLRALSKNRSSRFENLDQMNRALMKFLYSKYPDFNATDLSYFAQELFKDEIKKDREKLFEYGKIDLTPYRESMKKESALGNKEITVKVEDRFDGKTGPRKEVVIDFGFDTENSKLPTLECKKNKKNETVTSRRQTEKLANAGAGGNGPKERNSVGKNTSTKLKTETSIKREQGRTGKTLKNEETPKSSVVGFLVASLTLIMGAYLYKPDVYKKYYSNYIQKKSSKMMGTKRLPANALQSEEQASHVDLTLTNYNKQDMKVFVDGKEIKPSVLDSIEIPLGKEFTLRVQKTGKKHFIKKIAAQMAGPVTLEIPVMPNMIYGYLGMSESCKFRGKIYFELFGENRVEELPISNIAFPLNVDNDGNIITTKHIINFKKGPREMTSILEVTFSREDQLVDLCEKL